MKKKHLCFIVVIAEMLFATTLHAGIKGEPMYDTAGNPESALNGFKTGSGGSGLLYQYRTTTNMVKGTVLSDTMSIAMTDAKNSSVDYGGSKLIGHGNTPGYSVTLNPQNRTYRLNVLDVAATNRADKMNYQVTKIGDEVVEKYHCIHARLIYTVGRGLDITTDVWTSKDVPGYALMKDMMAMENASPKMLQALNQAGCEGIFVKMEMKSKDFSMSMLLTACERKSFPDAMFQIPPGYTETRGGR
jgi:hypothetical protein